MDAETAANAYEELLTNILNRGEEVRKFDQFLKAETAWLTAPASTRFHLAYPGGLLEHSVNVAQTMLTLRDSLDPELDRESCIILGLYHDVGKIGMPGKAYYLDNQDRWQKQHRGIHYTVNNELVHLDIATRSLYLLASRISLTDEEAQAIRYHDGQYICENKSVAHREAKLTRLLQYADNWAGGVLEHGK